jgi:hypothetical protein
MPSTRSGKKNPPPAETNDESVIRSHLAKLLEKQKSVPTVRQLKQSLRKKGHYVQDDSLFSKVLRNYSVELGQFTRKDKIPLYQTVGVVKSGVFFIDYGEFHKNWSDENEGATGFLVAVENLSNRLYATPTKGKDTTQWLNSIRQFVELTRDVKILMSDRDSVTTSPRFLKQIENLYQIKWFFLKKGHKSFLAERFIGFLKGKIGQALSIWGGKKWIHFLNEAVSAYNNEKIPGTSYKRKSISKHNFDHFASQLLKEKNLDTRFSSFKAGPFAHANWNKKIFKFDLGEKVLLARKSNWSVKRPIFLKTSEKGGFGKSIFTIESRQLRADRSFKHYVPVYGLKELGPSMHFYEKELAKTSAAAAVAAAAASSAK